MSASASGKTALVTGASSGLGAALCAALASRGYGLLLVGRDRGRLETVAGRVGGDGQGHEVVPVDLTSEEGIRRVAERAHARRTLDLLVHAAGVITLGPVETAALEDFDRQFQTNVRAPYHLTQALLPRLKDSRGDIVFLNSTAGLAARAQIVAYSASKHALKAVADGLREEVNPHGMRVLSVYLGRVATPMQEAIFRTEKRAYSGESLLQPDDVARAVLGLLDLPRTAEATDLTLRPAIKSY